MAYIPTITQQIDATTGLPNTRAGAESFGGLEGQALRGAGADIAGAGADIMQMGLREKIKNDAATMANAKANADFTPLQVESQKAYVPGTGPVQAAKDIGQKYDDWARTYVDGQKNLNADQRKQLMADLQLHKPAVTSAQAVHAAEQDGVASKEGATTALDVTINKVRNDPNAYSGALRDGLAVIDARPDLPQSTKEIMKNTFRSSLAMSKFQAMMGSATSAEDIDAISAQLVKGSPGETDPTTGKPTGNIDWTKQFSAAQYDQVVDGLRVARSSIGTKVDADTRAALTSLRERTDKLVSVDAQEIDATEKLVIASHNPVLQAEFYGIKAARAVKEREAGLPTAELVARNNAARGGPGMIPGLPPEVSAGAQDGQRLTGGKVSAGYLAGMAQREYGQNFKRVGGGTRDAKFAPVAEGTGDIRNLRPEVTDGLTIAGSIIGFPVSVFSGYRSEAHQDRLKAKNPAAYAAGLIANHSHHTDGDAVDIKTIGMADSDKAKLVDALVQGGFTGFGVYDSHIHADMRKATPDTMNLGGGFGGWTNLPPDVVAVLKKRGFGPGVDASKIDRRGANGEQPTATPVQWSVDYGKGTGITDQHGIAASSAVGVGQFTEGTWMETLANGGAERMGVDVAGKTREQLLELRKDPAIAMRGAAILAERNQADLAKGLGRDPSDPELYMAHLLGSGGATTLISMYAKNPSALAKDLLPGAAKTNHAVFYENGKALTVGEVYNNIATTFGAAPGRGGMAEIDARDKLIAQQKEGMKNDQVSFVQNNSNGRFVITPLTEDPSTYAQRGKDAQSWGTFYSVPAADIKPFSEAEVAAKTKLLAEGTAEDKLAELQRISAMPGLIATAALKQLGKDNPTFEQAGALARAGATDVATTVLRGDARRADPAYKASNGTVDGDAAKDFFAYAGRATAGLRPEDSNKIFQAALAHYVETNKLKGDNSIFDVASFRKSVDAVSGGVGQVNGAAVILPKGVDAATFDSALNSLTTGDLSRLSVDGHEPVTREGDPVDPKDIANEGRFEALGGNVYNVRLADDGFVLTDEGAKYRIQLDAKAIGELATRPSRAQLGPPIPNDGAIPIPGVKRAMTRPPAYPGAPENSSPPPFPIDTLANMGQVPAANIAPTVTAPPMAPFGIESVLGGLGG